MTTIFAQFTEEMLWYAWCNLKVTCQTPRSRESMRYSADDVDAILSDEEDDDNYDYHVVQAKKKVQQTTKPKGRQPKQHFKFQTGARK